MTLLQDKGERTIVTIGKRLDPLGTDALDWDRLAGAAGVYVTAGDAVALKLARQTPKTEILPRLHNRSTMAVHPRPWKGGCSP